MFLAGANQSYVALIGPGVVNGQRNENTNYLMTPEEFCGLFEMENKRNKTPQKTSKEMEELNMNTIFYGPPGTGKTYGLTEAVRNITGIGTGADNPPSSLKAVAEQSQIPHQVEFITFHQSYAYEDFIEGISARVKQGQVEYFVKNGLFKNLCRRALAYKLVGSEYNDDCYSFYAANTEESCRDAVSEQSNNTVPEDFSSFYEDLQKKIRTTNSPKSSETPCFVICIDEINRGNISSIFGELITLIEESKRQGSSDHLTSKLPHSGDELIVPDNLYILGTMNTADRSLVKLDVALRRRFDFIAKYPDYNVIDGTSLIYHEQNIQDVAKQINETIRSLKDSSDYELGHYYFMNIQGKEEEIENFDRKIIPLLHEYFQGDHNKIQQVLNFNNVQWTYDHETHEWQLN